MNSPEGLRHSARFRGFELDLRAGELRSASDVVVTLFSQPFQILLALLERPNEVVLREELKRKLWPDDTTVDFDHSLNVAINKLRKALGDRAEQPVYIETVASRGYRWLTDVEWTSPEPNRGMQDNFLSLPLAPKPARESALGNWRIAIAAGAAVLLVILLAWRLPRHETSVAGPVRLRQLTTNSQDLPVRSSAISPDGKYIAYSDGRGVHIKAIETGDVRNVSQPNGLRGQRVDWQVIAWFPDSTRFIANVSPPEEICLDCEHFSAWSFSVLDDEPHKLRDNVNAEAISPDGTLVAYTADLDLEGGRQILTTQPNGDRPTTLLQADRASLFRFVRWSPDGKRISYIHDHHQEPSYRQQHQP
jgi:DNA-binding winged helix-turn-helix (wHTH) protein